MSRSIPTEDRISILSDPILCHILSFLPTKYAATTSVLSKRWNPLWLSVPTLHFDNKTFETYPAFCNFVSAVFLSRDITLPLQSFRLKCSSYSNSVQHDINRFVYAAVQRRGLENLNLDMSNNARDVKINLHPRVFSCKTLVVLRLNKVSMDTLSDVVVDFPRLKTLHLSVVLFQRVEYLSKLLLGCPVLEDLNIKDLRLTFLNTLDSFDLQENIRCLTNLIRANISNMHYRLADDLFTLCSKAEVVHEEIDLSVGMKYWDARFRQLPMYHNLIYLEIILKYNHSQKWMWLLEVLKHCPKLQNLTTIIEGWAGNEDNLIHPTIVPECLSTQLKTCFIESSKITECDVQFAIYIMQNAKVLNTMSIKSVSSIDIKDKYEMIMKLATPARASTTCKLLFN